MKQSVSPTADEKVREFLNLVEGRERFVVTSHARPDGDAIGSSLGVMFLLRALGKQVDVVFADPIPTIYSTLPGADHITATIPGTPHDAAILLECDSFERAGFTAADFAEIPFIVNIDHHLSGKEFGHYNWIDPECVAVGAMVYDIAMESGIDIHCDMATCLYTAVLTDTGSFTYPSTVASTFGLAQHLVERGANPNRIAQAVFFSNPASKLYLLGEALRNLAVEGPIAYTWVTLEQIALSGATIEDCEGVVNYLINIAGVEAAFFLRELADGSFRCSLRSKDRVDVSKVAAAFKGGGHKNASGCTPDGPLSVATDNVVARLRQEVGSVPAASPTLQLC